MNVRERLTSWDSRVVGRTLAGTAGGRPAPSFVLSLGVLLVGVALALAGVVGTWRALQPTLFGGSVLTLPATVNRHLVAGDYEVFQRTGTRSGGSGLFRTEDGPTTIGLDDVVVAASDGAPVPVEPIDATDTLTRGSAVYTGAVGFHVVHEGTYAITIRANGGTAEAIVAPSIDEAFRRALPWLLTLAAGGVAAVVGLVLLIVGASRRRRPFPPGWYADPSGNGRLRWWDGVQWTAHVW